MYFRIWLTSIMFSEDFIKNQLYINEDHKKSVEQSYSSIWFGWGKNLFFFDPGINLIICKIISQEGFTLLLKNYVLAFPPKRTT